MAEISLPASSVAKICKAALPEGVHINKDVKKALNNITTGDIAKEKQGKNKKVQVMPTHLTEALEDMEFKTIARKVREVYPEAPAKRKINK